MKATTLSNYFNDVKIFDQFITEKYQLHLYAFTLVDIKDNKKKTIKYYINKQELAKAIGKSNIDMRIYEQTQNKGINVGFLDYVNFEGSSYISSTLISKSTEIQNFGIDMEELEKDVMNATIADEMNYANAVRDFAEFKLACNRSILTNADQIKFKMKQSYPFLDENYIEDIINLVMDSAVINFELPYNKLEFVNQLKTEMVDEMFDFFEDIIKDYRKDFMLKNNITPKQEFKQAEQEEINERNNELAEEFEAAIAKREQTKNTFDPSKLHMFVNAMEKALVGEIRKVRSDFPAGWILERFPQEACALQYTDVNGNHLLIKDAQQANQINPDTYNLGDELLAMFFLRHIGNQLATYEHKDENGIRSYIPFLEGKTQPDGRVEYPGLLTRSKYNNILRQNIVLLFPELTADQVTIAHFDIVRNYCASKI